MVKKYKILRNDSIDIYGKKLYRIQAIRNFGDIKKGDIGGYIQSQKNLAHDGDCWVYDDAVVFENAKISQDAKIYNNARIYGFAEIYGHAEIYDYVEVFDYAAIYNHTKIHNRAIVYNNARIFENAEIYDNVLVFDHAMVHGNAKIHNFAKIHGYVRIHDNTIVYDNANIYENIRAYNNALIYSNVRIKYGEVTDDIFSNMEKLIYNTFGVFPDKKGNYIFYKRVNKVSDTKFASLYDPDFIYEVGKLASVKKYNKNIFAPNGSGLHASTPYYWGNGDSLIQVQVNIKDIITCLDGEVRCKKLKVIREI